MEKRETSRPHLWIKTAFAVDEFAAQHLADLQDAAREIVSSLQRPAKPSIRKVVSG